VDARDGGASEGSVRIAHEVLAADLRPVSVHWRPWPCSATRSAPATYPPPSATIAASPLARSLRLRDRPSS